MTINNVFNELGVQAAVDYGKYQTVKGEDADFVDFLLSYDAKGAQEGDTSWLNDVSAVNQDKLMSITGQAMDALGKTNPLTSMTNMQNSDYFDTKVSALKYQLLEAFKDRIESSEDNKYVKSAKVTELYEKMQSVDIPSRFRG